MTEDEKTQTRQRLLAAEARVLNHPAEVAELHAAIVAALNAGWRPHEVDDLVHYDRNHIGRIARAGGVEPARRRKPKS